jgi:hypothetical protein
MRKSTLWLIEPHMTMPDSGAVFATPVHALRRKVMPSRRNADARIKELLPNVNRLPLLFPHGPILLSGAVVTTTPFLQALHPVARSTLNQARISKL